jgi:hypothetical protein
MLMSAARACQVAQDVHSKRRVDTLVDEGARSFVALRNFDATPMQLTFGSLQSTLAPTARYLVKKQVDGREVWKSVGLDEFVKQYGGRTLPHYGTCQVLGQTASIHLLSRSGALPREFHDIPLICSPQLCENGGASCIFAAVDSAVPLLSLAHLRLLAAKMRCGIIHYVPDMCPANLRTLAALCENTPRNIFHAEALCAAHKIHRVITTATNEDDIIGDVHAIAFIICLPCHREQLLKALRFVVFRDLVCDLGAPGPHRRHLDDIWIHCKQRQSKFVKGSIEDGEALIESPEERRLLDAHTKFTVMINGDPRQSKPQHICNGCCINADEAKLNYFSACVECGVVPLASLGTPSKNRWGTCHEVQAQEVFGMVTHSLFCQAADLAFPRNGDQIAEVLDPEADANDIDAMRLMIRNKRLRMTTVLGSEDRRMKHVCIAWLAPSLDHVLHRVQYLSERRDALMRCIDDKTSPIVECLRSLATRICVPLSEGPLETLFWLFDEGDAAKSFSLTMICDFAAQMWWRFLPLDTWPYALLKMVDVTRGEPAVRRVAADLYASGFCCLDVGFTVKALSRRVLFAFLLLPRRGILVVIRP